MSKLSYSKGKPPELYSMEVLDLLRILDRYPIHTIPELYSIIQFQYEDLDRLPRIPWTMDRLEEVLEKLEGFRTEIYDVATCSITGKILNRWWIKERTTTIFPILRGILAS